MYTARGLCPCEAHAFLDEKTFTLSFVGHSRIYKADHPLLEQALFEWIVHPFARNRYLEAIW
jgi:hypothetical protein